MNYYPFHIGDYASATRHLSWLEDAAYRRLLDVYYVKEEPLPLDIRQVYRLVVASTNEQRKAVDVVLGEFFELTDDGYRHSRCDAEIHAITEKRNKASQSAQSRWGNAKANNVALPSESERNANASKEQCVRIENNMQTQCEGNAPNPNTNTKVNKPARATPVGFAEFWDAYPKKVGKGAAEAAWKKQCPDLSVCLGAISLAAKSESWKCEGGKYIPNPSTWLNQKRWEDQHQNRMSTSGSIGGLPRRLMLADEVTQ